MQNQQVSDRFVGRKEEIDLFERWLVDEHAPAIFYLHDETEEQAKKGGIGKTRLLKEYMRRARMLYPNLAIVNVDFFNVADRDRIVIAERVVKSLQNAFPAWPASAFTRAFDEYFRGSTGSSSSPASDIDIRVRDALFDALALDLQELENMLVENGPFLLLFFDTFEVIEDNPVIAVLGRDRTFPDNYRSRRVRSVIAGRNTLDWSQQNWRGREHDVHDVALTPFDQQEMLAYIEAESLSDLSLQDEEIELLYALTTGRPILIGLATDVLNHQIMSLQELLAVPHTQFEERLVAQINRLENPLNWVILFMAHVYHRFNMGTLDWIARESNLKYTQGIDYQQLIQDLPDLSFVRQASSGNDFVLHDEMRRLVIGYCWEVQDAKRDIRQELSRCMISYCEQQMKQRLSEQEQQLYTIMKLYHQLFLDLAKGLDYFQNELRRAVNKWRSAFVRSLLQEVRLFTAELSKEQHYALIFAGAILLRSEEDVPAALLEHERLKQEADAGWFAEQEIEILIEKARCYLSLSQLQEASACFTQALDLARTRGEEGRVAYLLGQLGFIHRQRGELDKALAFYEECVVIQKAAGQEVGYADTLTNISNVYRLKGRVEEALRICKISLLLRRRLASEGKTGERAVALTLNALGLIYISSENFAQAEQVLLEAFDIYRRIDDKKSIAMVYTRLGRIELAKNNLERAQELFVEAQQASEDVNPAALIASLNRQARILLLQKRWQEAVPIFQRAITVADQIHDSYQRAECLLYFASAREYLGQMEEAQDLWQQMQELSTRENYLVLIARAEAVKGDVRYDAGDYAAAFDYYGKYCQYAVQYNSVEYNRALRKISDKLLDVPLEIVEPVLSALENHWTALGFEQLHPELISECEQLRQFMSL